MTKYVPPGFDRAKILDGLHKAMGFGEPNAADDKATFFFDSRDASAGPADGAGVPFDPDTHVTGTRTSKQVACAVEYYDRTGVIETFGEGRPTRVLLTILQPEWDLVEDFVFVVCGGDKYVRDTRQPPVALGSIDVQQIWCTAEGER